MAKGQAVHNLTSLIALRDVAPFYCTTRPQVVKAVGFETEKAWFVGRQEDGFVEWLFEDQEDCKAFHRLHGVAIMIRGKY